jgi:hypothetical protein
VGLDTYLGDHAVFKYQAVCFKEYGVADTSVGEENAEKYRVDEQIDQNLHHDIEPPKGPGVLERSLEEHRCVRIIGVVSVYIQYNCVYYCDTCKPRRTSLRGVR